MIKSDCTSFKIISKTTSRNIFIGNNTIIYIYIISTTNSLRKLHRDIRSSLYYYFNLFISKDFYKKKFVRNTFATTGELAATSSLASWLVLRPPALLNF